MSGLTELRIRSCCGVLDKPLGMYPGGFSSNPGSSSLSDETY